VNFPNIDSHTIRYLIVGFYNTVVGYLLFGLVNYVLGNFVHYLVILGVSFVLSVTHAYVGQRRVVFRSTGPWGREYLRFFVVNLSGMAANALLLIIFMQTGLKLMIAQAFSVLIVTVLSYFGHRKFSFKSA